MNMSTRVLAGLRGDLSGWDWESALLYSQADTEDKENRVSNTLFQAALARSTPDAYNPFNGGCITISLRATARQASRRPSIDHHGPDVPPQPDLTCVHVGFQAVAARPLQHLGWRCRRAVGVEARRETFEDNRDPRQDGAINFTDIISGLTSNDLLGNSASLDTPAPARCSRRTSNSRFRWCRTR